MKMSIFVLLFTGFLGLLLLGSCFYFEEDGSPATAQADSLYAALDSTSQSPAYALLEEARQLTQNAQYDSARALPMIFAKQVLSNEQSRSSSPFC